MVVQVKRVILILFAMTLLNGQSQIDKSQVDSSSIKYPGKALFFSIIPGGGQIYNRNPLKALLFAGAFAYYGFEYGQAQQDYDQDLTNQDLHRIRNDKIWMMGLIWTLNILDAYVDSQLWDFDNYDIDDGSPSSETEPLQSKKTGKTNDTE
ncbi:MAG: hypothetical protein HQ507_11930 [Candidatus Marinimicrobia bacterium]|nr:hypothetical protein [Candidatus Neomarinimicrobiota bacterium]